MGIELHMRGAAQEKRRAAVTVYFCNKKRFGCGTQGTCQASYVKEVVIQRQPADHVLKDDIE